MAKAPENLRICPNGHEYYKTSLCPVCPVCEKERIPDQEFLSGISAPARRALEGAGLVTLNQLSQVSIKDVLKLHGMGPGSIPKLKAALEEAGLSFKD